MSSLLNKKCVPCEGGIPPLSDEQIKEFHVEIDDWDVEEESGHKQISKKFRFKDFKTAMVFVNKVANLAESEGHHPNIEINFNKVRLVNYTHAINGLHDNDFILAAKINNLI